MRPTFSDVRMLALDADWQLIDEVAMRFRTTLEYVRRLAMIGRIEWLRGTERRDGRSLVLISCRSMARWAQSRVGLIRSLDDVDQSCC